ncbi:MAG: DUF2474 family protein [Sphingomonadaceae bacterium]|nr:DUF2474 family protein [Sphingomonadaceae bacterium]
MRTALERIGWLVLIWTASVATAGMVSLAIRWLVAPHHG